MDKAGLHGLLAARVVVEGQDPIRHRAVRGQSPFDLLLGRDGDVGIALDHPLAGQGIARGHIRLGEAQGGHAQVGGQVQGAQRWEERSGDPSLRPTVFGGEKAGVEGGIVGHQGAAARYAAAKTWDATKEGFSNAYKDLSQAYDKAASSAQSK